MDSQRKLNGHVGGNLSREPLHLLVNTSHEFANVASTVFRRAEINANVTNGSIAVQFTVSFHGHFRTDISKFFNVGSVPKIEPPITNTGTFLKSRATEYDSSPHPPSN